MSSEKLIRIATFYPAVVRKTSCLGYYIDYYVFDPTSDRMLRRMVQLKRLLKRYPTDRERRLAAQQVADGINRQLEEGWSPLHEQEDGRLYTPISQLCEKFMVAKEHDGVRQATLTSYQCIIGQFVRWCEDSGRGKKYSGTFLRGDAVRFLDTVAERGLSARYHNNMVKTLRVFFNWGMEHCYCKENPFERIKPKPKPPKRRILIDADARHRIADWFRREKPQMLLVSLLVYGSAIRPKEISNLKLKHVHLAQHFILIEEENAKNHHERCATISREAVHMLIPLLQQYGNGELYLFGNGKDMLPGKSRVSDTYFNRTWRRMREELGLPDEMQLYSLRDSGLTDLVHAGVDQLSVQHHADHSSLAMQQIYTDHYDPGLNDRIFNAVPEFG